MSLRGFDAAYPPSRRVASRYAVAGVYVGGRGALNIWTRPQVAALPVRGVFGIVVPSMRWPWPDVDEELDHTLAYAEQWGYAAGGPLYLDIEEPLAEAMGPDLGFVLQQWVSKAERRFRAGVYGSNRTLLEVPPRALRWLAAWPSPTPKSPACPPGVAAWQYAGNVAGGIDLDTLQPGTFARPDMKGVVNVTDAAAVPNAASDPAAFIVEGNGYWAVVPADLSQKRVLPTPEAGTALIAAGYQKLALPAAFVDSIPAAGAPAAAKVAGLPGVAAPAATAAPPASLSEALGAFLADPEAQKQFMALVASGVVPVPTVDDPGAAKPYAPPLTDAERAGIEAGAVE